MRPRDFSGDERMGDWKDPQIAAVRAVIQARTPPVGEPPPGLDERRAAMDANGAAGGLPKGCAMAEETVGGVACERLTPAEAVSGRIMLYLHGGAYCLGSPTSHRPLVARLAMAAKTEAVVADYRLGPEHPFPAAVDDALAVYRALLGAGAAPEKTVVAGDSAGGGLALALALAIKGAGLPQPAGFFVISPWADLTQAHATYQTKAASDPGISKDRLDEMAAAYLGGGDARDPLASPVFGDFEGVAPILIQVGSEEALLGDSLLVAERAGHAKVKVQLEVWPEMIHVWHAYGAVLNAARTAIKDAGAWMDARFG